MLTTAPKSEDDSWLEEFDNSTDQGLSVTESRSLDDIDDNFESNYFNGAHFYELFDQVGDASQMAESAGTYDEAFGPQI